jgi:hypothetical protein
MHWESVLFGIVAFSFIRFIKGFGRSFTWASMDCAARSGTAFMQLYVYLVEDAMRVGDMRMKIEANSKQNSASS